MNKLSHFLKETFRPHTREELTQATTQSGSGTPWLYLRVVLAVIFVIAPWLIYFLAFGYSDEFEAIIMSSLVFIIGYLILAYELAPGSEYKLWELLVLGVIGGVGSILLVLVMADIFAFAVTEEWHSALRAGIGEELYKFIAVAIILKVTKKKKPVDGLLVGLAVGAGFAFFENVMYIFRSSDVSDFVSCFIERNASAIFTHMFWSGLIGYAYRKLQHPWRDIRFYLVVLLAMGLHSGWDLPAFEWLPEFFHLDDFCNTTVWQWLFVGTDLVIASLAFISWFKARKRIMSETDAETTNTKTDAEEVKTPEVAESKEAHFVPSKYFFVVVMAFTFSAFLAIFSMLHNTSTQQSVISTKTDLGPVDEYILLSHDGLELEIDLKRPFDDTAQGTNYTEYYKQGVLQEVTQHVAVPGGFIAYEYEFNQKTGCLELDVGSVTYLRPVVKDDGTTSFECHHLYYAIDPAIENITANMSWSGARHNYVDDDTLVALYEYGKDYVAFFDLRDFTLNREDADTFKYSSFALIDGHVFGVETKTIRTLGEFETIDWVIIGACAATLLLELVLWIIESKKNKK